MSNAFLQRCGESTDRIARLRVFWEECLEEGLAEDGVTLELGCGHGHWLTAYAEQRPRQLCVGADLITKRVERANRKKEKRNLPRLRFLKAEAMELIKGMTPEVTLDETILLFPDPWPKKRHHKRRLVNDEFLDALAERTVVGGRLYFRTDHEEYFTWALEKVSKHALWRLLPEEPWPLEHETYFQNILPKHQSFSAEATPSN